MGIRIQGGGTKSQDASSSFRAIRYRVADAVNDSLRRIGLLWKFAKSVIRLKAAMWRSPDESRLNDKSSLMTGSATQGVDIPGRPQALASDDLAETVGINVAGYIESEKGVGEAARATLRSLKAVSMPYAVNNILDMSASGVERPGYRFSRKTPFGVNLIHVNADLIHRYVRRNRRSMEDHYNIAYWNWELSSFPEEWLDRFSGLQEVWVPSTFTLEAISRRSPIPVFRVPYSIDPDQTGGQDWLRAQLGLTLQTFVFLFYFDFHSFLERKNPIGLISAFRKAFGTQEDVALVIKCSHSRRASLALLERASERAPNIKFYDAILTREVLNSMLGGCDAYVSLHRSEGFGLTLTEAMNLGKPVIATAYSSNLDFMNEGNSFLVKYRLTEIEKDHGPYKKGCLWAEPDVDHAAELMRYAYHNRDQAAAIGKQGQREIRQLLHPSVIGSAIRSRVAEVLSHKTARERVG
jgi:glycosyltransferase involved in cell wall biosynthesis